MIKQTVRKNGANKETKPKGVLRETKQNPSKRITRRGKRSLKKMTGGKAQPTGENPSILILQKVEKRESKENGRMRMIKSKNKQNNKILSVIKQQKTSSKKEPGTITWPAVMNKKNRTRKASQ